jgi:hypothetical protein
MAHFILDGRKGGLNKENQAAAQLNFFIDLTFIQAMA